MSKLARSSGDGEFKQLIPLRYQSREHSSPCFLHVQRFDRQSDLRVHRIIFNRSSGAVVCLIISSYATVTATSRRNDADNDDKVYPGVGVPATTKPWRAERQSTLWRSAGLHHLYHEGTHLYGCDAGCHLVT
ncbi:hypothetical protein ElyMa_001621900 [Elysia marginata]|uniref:Uncharacterized protein n=1 Tax=Elysia marginata TaxID=1093978 RepID=A0AAV4JK54_9GAST|nr:hypothetical protein ElyMa_001621900 [Elysia marginata]